MPLYEYQCDTCGHRFERIQKFSDAPIAECPSCGGPVQKLVSSPAFQFKGSGWYVTDYARKPEKSEKSDRPEKGDKSDRPDKGDTGDRGSEGSASGASGADKTASTGTSGSSSSSDTAKAKPADSSGKTSGQK